MKITTFFDKGESKKWFDFDLGGHCCFSIDEIWPDGDAPENPTAEDVKKAIEDNYISLGSFIDDWNLADEIQLSIRGRDE